MTRLLYWLLVVPAYYDARDWMAKQWNRIAPLATPEQDTCESCRETSCDCTKVKTCNQMSGLPVGRKAGRPTRRTP
jgi:CO dehydrogenase/acetyl-CoA synthase alpha subunit